MTDANGKKEVEDFVVVDEFTKRKVLAYEDNIMLVAVVFNGTHESLDLHSHPHEQITYVKEGEFEYIIEGEIHILKKGESISVPQNVRHGARCISGEGYLLDSFSPVREDYL